MRTFVCGLCVALACLLASSSRGEEKGTEFKLDNLKSTTPADWKSEKPTSTLRLAQFRLPKAEGDKDDAELRVFSLGGSAKQNLERWKGEFQPPKGKSMDDVSKVEEFKVAGCAVLYFDVSGTWLDGAPGQPADKKTKREDYRMIAVQFNGPDNPFQFKLMGPAKTVEKHKKGFDEWLKGFK